MTVGDNRGLMEILLSGDWAWLRHFDSDGSTKDWAARVIQTQADEDLVERRFGSRIIGESGGYHSKEHRRGDGVNQALSVAEEKIHKGYVLLGGSPNLTEMRGESSDRQVGDDTESSNLDDEVVYARFSGHGPTAVGKLNGVLTTAAREVEQAFEHAGQRCPEVVIGESSYSTVILIGTWVFSIIRDAQHATHRANQVQLRQGEVRGGATVQPSQNPLAVALWLARVQRALAEHKGHVDLVDDDGRAIDPSFRDEAILLGEWGTDFETLRPALEHLELVEQKIDLGSLQAPVADNWF